jgi:hypothetical protein
MPDTSWALSGDEPQRTAHVAALVVARLAANPVDPSVRDLYERWGAYCASLDEHTAFVATADNVSTTEPWSLDRPPRDGVAPHDDDATRARLCWHLARTLVLSGVADRASISVDVLAVSIAGWSGLAFTDAGLERAKLHEATGRARALGTRPTDELARIHRESGWTMHTALIEGFFEETAARRALNRAWFDLETCRADCSRAEAGAVELAATRALAQSLGEQLERDEWIRARLRRIKTTPPVRAAIALRRRVLKRR